MRKIERLMNQAIYDSRNWKVDNTETRVKRDFNGTRCLEILLHGNKIAEIKYQPDYKELILFWTDSRYFSRTTFSRQNAILSQFIGPGVGLFHKKGTPYLQFCFNLGPLDLTSQERFSFSINN